MLQPHGCNGFLCSLFVVCTTAFHVYIKNNKGSKSDLKEFKRHRIDLCFDPALSEISACIAVHDNIKAHLCYIMCKEKSKTEKFRKLESLH